MTINLDKMKQKLDTLKNKNKPSNFWKPPEGDSVIRILPTEDGDPFKSFHFHYGVGSDGFLCPKANFGEPCAVCDFVAKLYKDKDPESVEMAKKIMKKQRFFSPILVRGDEKNGPKVWGYSKTVYEDFIKTVLNPDYGDITDPENGVDITISYGKQAGKKFPEAKPTYARKSSKMCKDMTKKECEELLAKIPDIDTLHTRKSSEDVALALEAFLNAAPEEQTVTASTEVADTSSEESAVDQAIRELST